MNKIYRVVFNKSLGIFNVVSELAKGATKASSGSTPKANKGRQLRRSINHLVHTVPLFALLAASPVVARLYWDTNGATPGSGNTGGVWDTTTSNWSNDPNGTLNGTIATTTWNGDPEVFFSAGTDGTGDLTIDIQPGGVNARYVLVEEGNLTFTGGDLAFSSPSQVSVSAGASARFNNNLTGDNYIRKTESGLLILAGTNTFGSNAGGAGAIVLQEGILRLEGGNAIADNVFVNFVGGGAEVLDLANTNETIGGLYGDGLMSSITLGSATLTINNNRTASYGGVISGTGGLTKQNSGTQTLTGDNTFVGPLAVNGGILQLGNNTTTGSIDGTVDVSIGDGATLTINRSNDYTMGNKISGNGSLVKTGDGTLRLTNTNNTLTSTQSNGVHLLNGTLTINGGTYRAETNPAFSGSNRNAVKVSAGSVTTNLELTDVSLSTIGSDIYGGGDALNVQASTGGQANVTVNRGTLSSEAPGMGGVNAGAFGGGRVSMTLDNVTISTTGAASAPSGSGSTGVFVISSAAVTDAEVTINGGSITTTANGESLVNFRGGAVGMRASNGRINATDVAVSSNGFAAWVTDGGVMNVTGGSLTSTGQGTTTSLAGAAVSDKSTLTLTNTTVASSGIDISGVVSRTLNNAPTTVTMSGTTVNTSGDGAAGLLANGNGANIVLRGNNSISTTGAQAHGLHASNAGGIQTVFNQTPTLAISAQGAGSYAVVADSGGSVGINSSQLVNVAGAAAPIEALADGGMVFMANGASGLSAGYARNGGLLGFDDANADGTSLVAQNGGTVGFFNSANGDAATRVNAELGGTFDISGSTTGTVTVGGAEGAGSFKLGGNTLTTGSDGSSTTISGVLSDGGISGGTGGALTKVGASTLTLSGDNTYTGATTVSQGTLQLGDGGTTGSVVGNILLSTDTTLVVNRSNDLTLTGVLDGPGDLKQVGTGTLTLTGLNSTVRNVDIQQGRLTFAQPGDFTVTGNLNTASGATLGVGAVDATLKIGGVLTQAASSRLDAILGASPDITADSAVLDGELTISGFSLGAQPERASEVTQNNYTLIRTVNGITGNFSNLSIDGSLVGNSGLDYLESYAFRSNDLKEYQLGFDLAWTTVNDDRRTGSFTLNADTGFNVDIALENQAPSALTGWDGKTLTKNGEGLLQLSAVNTYTGDTLLNGGVLKLDGAGNIASSNALTISGGQFDISSAVGNRTVNNLSGTGGKIMLAGKTLTVNNAQDGTFAGDFDASTGGLVKEGNGALVLSGSTAFTGDTLLNAGQLTLDGSNGKAQLVSNIIGQTGTRLNLANGAVLTGTIDPTDVTIDRASVWNITGTSDVATLTLAGNINFADPGATLQSGRTLTATNWVGQGGTVNMYAALGGNDSVADKLIIDGGQATGRTDLNIRNAGGLGDQTTGNGINVVQTQNSATTAVDAFGLANASGKVLAGAYEYRLARAGEDWFLQSGLNQVDPVEPVRPVYSPVTSLHTAKAEQALQYAESTVGTLYERMGDLEALNAKTDNLAWGRVIGKHVSNDGASDGIYGNDIDSHGDISALQIGNDFYVNAEGKGRTSAGAFLTFGHGKYDVTHAYNANDHIAAGDNSFDAYSLGGYVTHLNGEGGYLDTVVQVTSFDQTVAPRGLASKSSNALGVLASVEVGQRFDVGAPEQGLHVEPQAQVIVQTLKQDDSKVVSNVGTESNVSYDRSTILTSRVGARLSKTWLTTDEGAASVWITPSVINTIGDDSQTRFATPSQGDVTLNNQLSGTRASLQLGIDGQVAKGISVSARLGVENRIDGDSSSVSAYGGQLGLKILF
ncbi:autotransporter outer membrane beta-barrel domain-containing protein [Aeromonas veronii]|uniref:autotransporter outer membrane beta-barrel domain-containing protein n=1 Tax=Aeromonas veronii TaxID=654 RepID=UPI00226C9960|nr:autotransporter outer membrane beta-barrel domain-containing protein [Aeromonas veronii]MCX9134850.1 autotransporter outer membrane beta-barrel domain-containing protein [Aeromonas veronii]